MPEPFDPKIFRSFSDVMAASEATPFDTSPQWIAEVVPASRCLADFSSTLDGRGLIDADASMESVTTMEFELIEAFLVNPHRALSRDRLFDLDPGGVTIRSIHRLIFA